MTSKRIIEGTLIVAALGVALLLGHHGRMHSSLARGECTWYAFERAHERGWNIRFDKPYGRHARAWWEKVTNAQQSSVPKVGSIMVLDAWKGNPYGHVAYVESVSGKDHWVISHANFGVGTQERTLDGVPVLRARCERIPRGVRLEGAMGSFLLRGFLSPSAANRSASQDLNSIGERRVVGEGPIIGHSAHAKIL